MAHFVVYMLDKSDTGPLRETVRPRHLQFIKGLGPRIKVGGPLLAPDGETKIGGMYILDADDLPSARAVAESDPFFIEGVAAALDVRPWRWQTDNR
jgi:uncharacterized protein YciI